MLEVQKLSTILRIYTVEFLNL